MMQAMPNNLQQGNSVVEVSEIVTSWKSIGKFQQELQQVFSSDINNNNSGKNKNKNSSRTSSSVESEPTSTLDTPNNPPASTSTLLSSAGVAVTAASGSGDGGGGIGLEEWDSLFPNGDGALLPWIMDNDQGFGMKNSVQFEGNAGFESHSFDLNPSQLQIQSHFAVVGVEKPQICNPNMLLNQQIAHKSTNPSFVMSANGATLGNYCQQEFEKFQPHPKRHNPGAQNPFVDPGYHEMLLRKQSQQMGIMFPQQVQLEGHGVKDQLFKAADLIQTGNFSLAQEILARLNHQLSFPGKPPLVRAALFAKEALQMLLQLSNPDSATPPKMLTPYDVVHKMNAYKVFSEVSPITQFVNFTCTQAILEVVDESHAIHIVDFDIGCGAQWASFIQELPLRKVGAPSLRITAVVQPRTHPFELALVRENLVQFANDTGIAFEFQVVYLDSFDPSSSSLPNFGTSVDECIAVSIPIWSSSTRPSLLPSILRFIKEHSPKIVVSLDKGFDRCDVPFPQHVIHSLESCTNILESLDGQNVASDIVSKIEKFFIQPRIENSILGRLHAPNKTPHWKNLFASAGLVPLQFSNFTETQADYVVKRTPGRGFHVDKQQASLVLSWQRRELVAASAWRC